MGPRCPYQGPPDALHCVLLCGSLLETHALHFASSPVAIIWDVFRLSSLAMGSVAERGHTECAPPRPPRHRPLCSRIPVGGDRHICARRAHGVRGSWTWLRARTLRAALTTFSMSPSSQGSWGTAPVCPLPPAFPAFTKMPSESTAPSRACACSSGEEDRTCRASPSSGERSLSLIPFSPLPSALLPFAFGFVFALL